ncbi:MAG: glycosyltransferase, partial [Chloroflexi bacterium]|nr:glycosyltransferase [Chloroflexota bacterium]
MNLTLNGDTNARVMEVLAAGGCLVTDRLAPQAGINALLTEGEHFVGFDDDDELVERVREYLANPELALEIACNGHQKYAAEHSPKRRVEQFWEYFEGKSDELERLAEHDQRVTRARDAGKIEWPLLLARIQMYEFLQEQVRVRSGVKVFYSSGVEPLTVADSADLSRLHRAYACFPDEAPWAWDGLRALGVSGQVVPTRIEAVIDEEWDLIVIGSDDFVDPYMMNLLTRITTGRIAIAGNGKPIPPSRRMVLSQLGWLPDPEWPSLHVRLSKPAVPEVDAIAPAGAEEYLSSPAPGAVGRGPELSRTSEIEHESPGSTDTLALAHDTVAKFDWQSVAQYLPPEMNALVATGIVRSLVEARPVDGRGYPIPAFVHGATDFIEPLLRPEWHVLVWGSGADLGWWSSRVAKVAAILAPGAYDPKH